ENSGVEGSIVVGKILESKEETFGFDAQTENYVDMVEKGIIDPAKVVRAALQDAASVAGLRVTTEAMVAEAPKKQAPGPAIPPGGGMGGVDPGARRNDRSPNKEARPKPRLFHCGTSSGFRRTWCAPARMPILVARRRNSDDAPGAASSASASM